VRPSLGEVRNDHEVPERGKDHQFYGARPHRFVFQGPGVLERDVNGVRRSSLRIDIAARAVPIIPAVGLHDLCCNQSAVRYGIVFRNDFDEFENPAGPIALPWRLPPQVRHLVTKSGGAGSVRYASVSGTPFQECSAAFAPGR